MYCVLVGARGGEGGGEGGEGGSGIGLGGANGGGGPCGGSGGGLGGGGGGLGTGLGGGAGGCGGEGTRGGEGGGETVAYCATPVRTSCIGTHASASTPRPSVLIHARKSVIVAESDWYEHVMTS